MWLCLFSPLLLVVGCLQEGDRHSDDSYIYNSRAVDTTTLQAGDLILRMGYGLLSESFCKIASREQRYSHCGIIDYQPRRGGWVVWHAYGEEQIGANGIFCQPLIDFLRESHSCQVYHRPEIDSLGLSRIRQFIYEREPGGRYAKTFDRAFDLRDTTTIYCTEFVALAYRSTLHPALQIRPTGHSPFAPYPYYSLDDVRQGL